MTKSKESKNQLRLLLFGYMLALSCARKTFQPKNVLIQRHGAKSISEAIIQIRGGSDRGYSYDRNDDYGRYDDRRGSGSGYDYRGEGGRYDYEDDRYADDGRGGVDDYYGDDRDYGRRRESYDRPSPSKSLKTSMPDVGGILRNGNKKIGMMALGGGAVFTLLGISLFFNKTLMRLGNLLFIVGVPLFIGPGRTTGYFLQPKKARATGCLGLGIFLVFIGWPVFGMALEIFGILNLFGNMFPVLMVLLKQMPIVGNLMNSNNSGSNRKKSPPRRDSYRYDENEDYRYNEEEEDDRYRY